MPRRGPFQEPYLTPRELEVLNLIAQGFRYRDVAETLGISVHTVRRHIDSIRDKSPQTRRSAAALVTKWLGPQLRAEESDMREGTTTATEPTAMARQLAGVMWDHFRALVQQGFTEAQALMLLGTLFGTALAKSQSDVPGQR